MVWAGWMTARDVLGLREKPVARSPSHLLPGSGPHFAAIEGNAEPAQGHSDPLCLLWMQPSKALPGLTDGPINVESSCFVSCLKRS